tara:strand:+ start:864 stop:1640 length:777 start_codon:yes stop_codon:yes gene_type:complete
MTEEIAIGSDHHGDVETLEEELEGAEDAEHIYYAGDAGQMYIDADHPMRQYQEEGMETREALDIYVSKHPEEARKYFEDVIESTKRTRELLDRYDPSDITHFAGNGVMVWDGLIEKYFPEMELVSSIYDEMNIPYETLSKVDHYGETSVITVPFPMDDELEDSLAESIEEILHYQPRKIIQIQHEHPTDEAGRGRKCEHKELYYDIMRRLSNLDSVEEYQLYYGHIQKGLEEFRFTDKEFGIEMIHSHEGGRFTRGKL